MGVKIDLDEIRKNGSKESKNSIFFSNSVKINKTLLVDDNNKPINFIKFNIVLLSDYEKK